MSKVRLIDAYNENARTRRACISPPSRSHPWPTTAKTSVFPQQKGFRFHIPGGISATRGLLLEPPNHLTDLPTTNGAFSAALTHRSRRPVPEILAFLGLSCQIFVERVGHEGGGSFPPSRLLDTHRAHSGQEATAASTPLIRPPARYPPGCFLGYRRVFWVLASGGLSLSRCRPLSLDCARRVYSCVPPCSAEHP